MARRRKTPEELAREMGSVPESDPEVDSLFSDLLSRPAPKSQIFSDDLLASLVEKESAPVPAEPEAPLPDRDMSGFAQAIGIMDKSSPMPEWGPRSGYVPDRKSLGFGVSTDARTEEEAQDSLGQLRELLSGRYSSPRQSAAEQFGATHRPITEDDLRKKWVLDYLTGGQQYATQQQNALIAQNQQYRQGMDAAMAEDRQYADRNQLVSPAEAEFLVRMGVSPEAAAQATKADLQMARSAPYLYAKDQERYQRRDISTRDAVVDANMGRDRLVNSAIQAQKDRESRERQMQMRLAAAKKKLGGRGFSIRSQGDVEEVLKLIYGDQGELADDEAQVDAARKLIMSDPKAYEIALKKAIDKTSERAVGLFRGDLREEAEGEKLATAEKGAETQTMMSDLRDAMAAWDELNSGGAFDNWKFNAAANSPIAADKLTAAVLTPEQQVAWTKVQQFLQNVRHDMYGSALTANEATAFKEAMGLGLMKNPEALAAVLNQTYGKYSRLGKVYEQAQQRKAKRSSPGGRGAMPAPATKSRTPIEESLGFEAD